MVNIVLHTDWPVRSAFKKGTWMGRFKTNSQASKLESLKLCSLTHSLAHLPTGVKCRATSVAKKALVWAGFEKRALV